ncbi:MAG: hypothetical protein IKG87_10120 [Clostridia bacterium]|nr:hypothetical protein [Clostridia bacterium]
MFFFVREGKYVSAVNKFWFWIAVVAAILGACMSCSLLSRANHLLIGIILALLFLGCAVFDVLFLSAGKRSYGIIACCFGIATTIIPFILQCVKLDSDSYISPAGCGVITVIATIWALNSSKKIVQIWDTKMKECIMLKNKQSRIPMAVFYVLALAGIILSVAAVATGTLPAYP